MAVPYHGTENRGMKNVHLIQTEYSLEESSLLAGAETLDLTFNNITLPPYNTYYWCQLFRNPYISKRHIVMIEPVIRNPGPKDLVHHITLFVCQGHMDRKLDGKSWRCYYENRDLLNRCIAILFSWAIGGERFYFPRETGFPVSVNDPAFFRVEIHYNSPKIVPGMWDRSGLRLWTTPTLRRYDAATLTTGTHIDPMFAIPPYQDRFRMTGRCNNQCLKEGFSDSDPSISALHVFSVQLHAHLIAVAARVRHLRQGKELAVLASNENFDFNYQEYRSPKENATILPIDEIVVECDFNSSKRTTVTRGGLAAHKEMCFAFLVYYPRLKLTHCSSDPSDVNVFRFVETDFKLEPYNETVFHLGEEPATEHRVASSEGPHKGLTAAEILDKTQWTADKAQKYEAQIANGIFVHQCTYKTKKLKSDGIEVQDQKIDRWEPTKKTCDIFTPSLMGNELLCSKSNITDMLCNSSLRLSILLPLNGYVLFIGLSTFLYFKTLPNL